MKQILIRQESISEDVAERLKRLCPFGAIEGSAGDLHINAACKLCGLCVKGDPPGTPPGLITIDEVREALIDKSLWRGVAVFIDYTEGSLHPVSLELLGKARELAGAIGHPVYAYLIGCGVEDTARDLLYYGIDDVYCCDDVRFRRFLPEDYAAALELFIRESRPCAVLFGATNAGRSLAPRVAARFRTGLTADCTALEMKENSDLVQIRPAFGGNIMARILTTNCRPQMCTVRYKIFDRPLPGRVESGIIHRISAANVKAADGAEILEQTPKPPQTDISEAGLILALGRGVANKKDIVWLADFAASIGARIACTRPLAESGWLDPRLQIGLSGRTVKPKLIICAGISGSVQFAAGMSGADCIVAINADPQAPIFRIAHLGLVGDLYEILPGTAELLLAYRKGGVGCGYGEAE